MFKIDNIVYFERRDILKDANIDNYLWRKMLSIYNIKPHTFKTKDGIKHGYTEQEVERINLLFRVI